MAPHSSTSAWKIPWTEEPAGLQSMGSIESDTTARQVVMILGGRHSGRGQARKEWAPVLRGQGEAAYKIDNKYQKAKVKNLSRGWNFKNTMLKKGRRKRKRKQTNKQKQSHKNYKKKYRYKIDNKYQKA